MENNKITDYLKNTCKIGQNEDCCRYLLVGGHGFECGKLTSMKETIDLRVENGSFVAQADGCDGLDEVQGFMKLNKRQNGDSKTDIKRRI